MSHWWFARVDRLARTRGVRAHPIVGCVDRLSDHPGAALTDWRLPVFERPIRPLTLQARCARRPATSIANSCASCALPTSMVQAGPWSAPEGTTEYYRRAIANTNAGVIPHQLAPDCKR